MKTFAALVCVFCFLFAFQPLVKSLPGAAAGKIQDQTEEKKEEEKKKEKKKEEEKKKEKKKQKVITNEDLKNITGVNVTFVEPEKKAKAKTKQTSRGSRKNKTSVKKKKPVDPKTTEKYWRDRWSKLAARIAKSEAKIKEMKEKLLRLKLEHPGIDLTNERLKREEEMRKLAGSIQSYERGLKTLKQSMEDLEEEARRAGVPPGWLR